MLDFDDFMHLNFIKFLGLSALLLGSRLSASSVSASCTVYSWISPPQTVVQTGATAANCQPATYTYAIAQVTLQLASNPADWNTLNTSQATLSGPGLADDIPTHLFGAGSESHTVLAYQDFLTTAGPLRAGYLQWQGGGGVQQDNGSAGLTAGIISPNPHSPYTEINCVATQLGCTPGPGYYAEMYPRIPVLLGVPFTLEATGYTDAYYYSDGTGAFVQATYQFRFFEADGMTPVAVSETPEPSSITLCSLAGAILVFSLRRRQKA